jgi:hypothetical protein
VSAHRPPGARLCSFPPQPRPAQRALTWSQPGYGLPQLSASATVDLRLGNDHDFTAALRKNERINYGCWPLVSSDAVTASRRSCTSPARKSARKPYLLRFDRVQLRSACRQPLHFKPVQMGLLQHSYRLAIGAQLGQATRMRPGSQGLHPSCLQRETVAGATPTSLATSRTPLPGCNNLAPIIRRISSASALPFVLMAQNIYTSLLLQHEGQSGPLCQI